MIFAETFIPGFLQIFLIMAISSLFGGPMQNVVSQTMVRGFQTFFYLFFKNTIMLYNFQS